MSTASIKRKQAGLNGTYFDGYVVGKTIEEIHEQEAAALDRYVMKQAMEMTRPKADCRQSRERDKAVSL